MKPAVTGVDPRNGETSEARQRPEASNQTTPQALSYPSPHSVKGRILGAHLRGETLTGKDCWLRFGSSRLAHHEMMLRRAGWKIDMAWEDATTSDAGRVAQIGRYWLPADVIEAVGERGQKYAAECARIEVERRAA